VQTWFFCAILILSFYCLGNIGPTRNASPNKHPLLQQSWNQKLFRGLTSLNYLKSCFHDYRTRIMPLAAFIGHILSLPSSYEQLFHSLKHFEAFQMPSTASICIKTTNYNVPLTTSTVAHPSRTICHHIDPLLC